MSESIFEKSFSEKNEIRTKKGLGVLDEKEKKQKNERIYRFISKYSHLQAIDFGDDAENNLIGEFGGYKNIKKENPSKLLGFFLFIFFLEIKYNIWII